METSKNASQYCLSLTTLECIETEDWTGPDDIYFKVVPDDKQELLIMYNNNLRINNGQSVTLDIAPIYFTRTIKLTVMDYDSADSDDCLGTNVLFGGESKVQPGSVTDAKYTEDDANYKLTYIVHQL